MYTEQRRSKRRFLFPLVPLLLFPSLSLDISLSLSSYSLSLHLSLSDIGEIYRRICAVFLFLPEGLFCVCVIRDKGKANKKLCTIALLLITFREDNCKLKKNSAFKFVQQKNKACCPGQLYVTDQLTDTQVNCRAALLP